MLHLASLSVFTLFFSYLAQAQGPVQAYPITIPQSPGNYEFTHYNPTASEQAIIAEIFKRSAEDKVKFESKLNEVENALINFSKKYLFGAHVGGQQKPPVVGRVISFGAMSDLARLGGENSAAYAADYLATVRTYQAEKLTLGTQVKTMQVLAGSFAPVSIETKEGKRKITKRYNFDPKPFVDYYEAVLAAVESRLQNLYQVINLVDGVTKVISGNSGNALDVDQHILPQISSARISELQGKIRELRQYGENDDKLVVAYFQKTKSFISKFMETYGTEQKWRVTLDSQRQQKLQILQDIRNAFWTRSYIRTVYEIPLYSFGYSYKKSKVNLDIVTASSQGMTRFFEQPVKMEEDLTKSLDALDLALYTNDTRNKTIADLRSGNLNALEIFQSAFTFVKGEAPLADVLSSILTLVAADVAEEYKLTKATSQEDMITYYKSRFKKVKNSLSYNYYKKLETTFAPEEFLNQTTTLPQKSFKEAYFYVSQMIARKTMDYTRASEIQTSLSALTQFVKNSPVGKKIEERKKSLD